MASTDPQLAMLDAFQLLLRANDAGAVALKATFSRDKDQAAFLAAAKKIVDQHNGTTAAVTTASPRTTTPRARSSNNSHSSSGGDRPLPGFIFFCNDRTVGDCLNRSLFGLHRNDFEGMKRIRNDTPLFLFNFSKRQVYGVFYSASEPGLNLEPDAWKNAGRPGRSRPDAPPESPFPAQIRVCRDGRIKAWKPPESVKYDPGPLDADQVRLLTAKLEAERAAPETDKVLPRAAAEAREAARVANGGASQQYSTPPATPPPPSSRRMDPKEREAIDFVIECSGAVDRLGSREQALVTCTRALEFAKNGKGWPRGGAAQQQITQDALEQVMAALEKQPSPPPNRPQRQQQQPAKQQPQPPARQTPQPPPPARQPQPVVPTPPTAPPTPPRAPSPPPPKPLSPPQYRPLGSASSDPIPDVSDPFAALRIGNNPLPLPSAATSSSASLAPSSPVLTTPAAPSQATGLVLYADDKMLEAAYASEPFALQNANAAMHAREHTHLFLVDVMSSTIHGAFGHSEDESIGANLLLEGYGRPSELGIPKSEVQTLLMALVHTRGPAAVRGVIPDANLQVLLAHAGCSSSGASPNARAGGGLERFSNGSDGDHLASANPFGSMILLDGASIASTSSNLNGGYLNVTAIVTAIDYYMDKHADNTVICLVPAHWFVPRPTGDQPDHVKLRQKLRNLQETGIVFTAPEEGKCSLPPIASWALLDCDHPAILVSNDANLTTGCREAATHSLELMAAMRDWLKLWICPFSFKTTGGNQLFEPSPSFHMPRLHMGLGGVAFENGAADSINGTTLHGQLRSHFQSLLTSSVEDLAQEAWRQQQVIDEILNGIELPAVAAARADQLDLLANRIDQIGRKSSEAWNFDDEKSAWDVLNKVIFFCKQDQNASCGVFDHDAVIPSDLEDFPEMMEHCAKQLRATQAYGPHLPDDLVLEVVKRFTEAAKAVDAKRKAERERMRQRLSKGKMLTDATLGMRLYGDEESDDPEATVTIRWTDEVNGGEVVHDQTMWRKHFHRLRSLYEHHAPRPTRMLDHRNLMLTRIFSMALRYDCLSKTKSAYQAALPHKLMQRLSTKLGVNHECFASPLNHYFPSYCSVFHDTDHYFGSKGSFYSYAPAEGVYECNPPFDNASVQAAFLRIGALLAASDMVRQGQAARPLSFVFVIPCMDFNPQLKEAHNAVKRFETRTVVAEVNRHVYRVGLQHRRTGHGQGDNFWRPEKASRIYFFQNSTGRHAHPITEELVNDILHDFDY